VAIRRDLPQLFEADPEFWRFAVPIEPEARDGVRARPALLAKKSLAFSLSLRPE